MFLIGLYAGKKRFFQRINELKPSLTKLWVVAGFCGIAGNAVFVWAYHLQNLFVPNLYNVVYAGTQILAVPGMTLFYILSFCLVAGSQFGTKLFRLFAPMGKIALSNYVLQSLIQNILLFGFGFGLYGTVSPAQGILWCLGIYSAQLIFSH